MKKVVLFHLCLVLLASVLYAIENDDHHHPDCGALYGLVKDIESAEAVAGTQILIIELNRSGVSHQDGHFYIPGLPVGTYTLQTFRIGYTSVIQKVDINLCDTNKVELKIYNTPLTMQAITLQQSRINSTETQLDHRPVHLEGKTLRQNLSSTIAETIQDEPGLDKRTMGPAPARPVLRGMSGDRLLLLENGERTGDLSATSADHAVVIEPLTAERIQVIRGPQALQYGANTIGGVVNVDREYVPTTHLDHIHGSATLQGESVNSGIAAGMGLVMPAGPLSLKMDASYRNAENIQTPSGTLDNTSIYTTSGSGGLSFVKRWGYVGAAAAYYKSQYGIPGGFVGAHPNGVDIELERKHSEIKANLFISGSTVQQISYHGSYSKYLHQEFESSGLIGIEFGVLSYHNSVLVEFEEYGPFLNGKIGFWSEYRDYAAGGYSFTPPTKETTLAGFIYQEADLGKVNIKAALRCDHRRVDPEIEEQTPIGYVRERTFADISASLSAHYHFTHHLYSGFTIMRSFRPPGIEELFSQGPHLAAYAFEVGNPNLDKETGLGFDLYGRYTFASGSVQISLFRNQFNNYIFPRNTGEINYRTLLSIYQYTGLDAVIKGAELAFEWEFIHHLALKGMLNSVKGTSTNDNQPLPYIPPLSGKLEINFNRQKTQSGIRLRMAQAQNRVGKFEQPTPGYQVLDLYTALILSAGSLVHTITFGIDNVFDQEYRRHLSRVKEIMPEPGRNIKLLYRVYF